MRYREGLDSQQHGAVIAETFSLNSSFILNEFLFFSYWIVLFFFCSIRDLSYNEIQQLPSLQGCIRLQEMWVLNMQESFHKLMQTGAAVKRKTTYSLWSQKQCVHCCFHTTEAFSTTTSNRSTGTPSRVCLLSVYCKSTHGVQHAVRDDVFKPVLWAECVFMLHRDLSRNQIRVIHRDAFLTLTALTNLWVQSALSYSDCLHHLFGPTDLCWKKAIKPLLLVNEFHRDLSMNSLTVIPTTGLSALSQLKLSGNPQMKNVLPAKNLPKLRWEGNTCVFLSVLSSMKCFRDNAEKHINTIHIYAVCGHHLCPLCQCYVCIKYCNIIRLAK